MIEIKRTGKASIGRGAAAKAYRTSIDLLRLPFVTAQRAQIMDQLSYTDVAAAEALVMDDYPAAAAVRTEYPLPEDLLQSWMLYFDMTKRSGGTVDYSMLPGQPFRIAFLSDGSVLLSDTNDLILTFNNDHPSHAALLYPENDDAVLNAYWLSTPVRLTFEDKIGVIYSYYAGGDEFYSETKILIVPADVPDPRESQHERCENGARWRLALDGYGTGAIYYYNTTEYYDAPGGKLIGTLNEDLNTFRVVSGPVCLASQAWWEVDLLQNDGQTYWLPEAEGQSSDKLQGLIYYVKPSLAPSK